MARKLRVAVVSPEELRQHCGALMQQGGYSAARCVETHQRARLFRMLFEVAAANDVALLCDVDEIAKPQTLQRLRRAPPFGPNGSAPHKVVLEAIDYKFGVHCAMRAPWTGLHAYSVAFLLRNPRIAEGDAAAQRACATSRTCTRRPLRCRRAGSRTS